MIGASAALYRREARSRRRRFLLLPLALALLLCQCQLRNAHTMIGQTRDEVYRMEGVELDEASRYHVAIAKGLLAVAEKQYEDADFAAAAKFATRAHEQVERALQLQKLHEAAGKSSQQ